MKKWDKLFSGILLIVTLCAIGNISMLSAEDQRKAIGNSMTVASVNVTSFTGTALWSAAANRPDGVLFNNSAFTIWIGTDSNAYNSIGTASPQHPNITNGFPVLASSTFRLDGSYTGTMYGTADVGAATLNIRILNGQVP